MRQRAVLGIMTSCVMVSVSFHPAAAQERHTMADYSALHRAEQVTVSHVRSLPQRQSGANALLAGAAGGGAGYLLGALVADLVCEPEHSHSCNVVGTTSGLSFGIPLGVHLAYGGGGPLGTTAAISLMLGTIRFMPVGDFALAVPAIQLVTAIALEVGQAAPEG